MADTTTPRQMFRSTPCPECQLEMVYECTWLQEHPGLVDPIDITDWRWVVVLDTDQSSCECRHTCNVEQWEAERAMAGVNEPWESRVHAVY